MIGLDLRGAWLKITTDLRGHQEGQPGRSLLLGILAFRRVGVVYG
jgi:hypothetical protein